MDWGAVATVVVAILGGAGWIVIELASLKRDVANLAKSVNKRLDKHDEWHDDACDRITRLEAKRA